MTAVSVACAVLALLAPAPHALAGRQGVTLVDQFWTALPPAVSAANGWTLRGVTLGPEGTLAVAAAPAPIPCASSDIDGGAAGFDPVTGLCVGRDPYPPGRYRGGSYYNGSRFHYGTILSPPRDAAPFDRAVVSWVAATLPGTWLQAHLRVRLATGVWTRWYKLPVWASGMDTIRRHSVDGQGGVSAVETDTLALHRGYTAVGYQLGVTLFTTGSPTPLLRRLSLALSYHPPGLPTGNLAQAGDPVRWHGDLAVPARSQMLARYRGSLYGGGGEVWCSPTSTAMILAYWARVLHRPDLDVSVPDAARDTYDWTYDGTGNWPYNVAYATSFPHMDGYVARFPSLDALEPWIAAGVPLALAISYGRGVLPGAPNPSSNGHLIVLRGFDRAGHPIVNDPGGHTDTAVRRVYPRAALQDAWLAGSGGTAYVIFPRGWPVPSPAQ